MSRPARPTLHPAVVPGRPRRLDPQQALLARVRMVLETRPGQVPWRPELGCDLAGLVGQPASGATLQLARSRVEGALTRWVPEARLLRCEVRVVTDQGAHPDAARSAADLGGASLPTAEATLMRLGGAAWLSVRVELASERGVLAFETQLHPGN